MWTWKTEQAADWSMQTGLTYGWIPSPVWNKTKGSVQRTGCSRSRRMGIDDQGAVSDDLRQSRWSRSEGQSARNMPRVGGGGTVIRVLGVIAI